VAKQAKLKKKAVAVHRTDGKTHQVNLCVNVAVWNDDESWFAQSLEIDYAAEGTDLSDLKRRFTWGLVTTIGMHLSMYGNLDKLMVPAPAGAWLEFFKATRQFKYTQETLHGMAKKEGLPVPTFPDMNLNFQLLQGATA
jgi:hypothetical protein